LGETTYLELFQTGQKSFLRLGLKSDSCLVIPKTVVSQYFNNQPADDDLKELKEFHFDRDLLHPAVDDNSSSRRSSENSEAAAPGVGGAGRRGRRSSSVHNLFLFSSAAMAAAAGRKRSDDAASSRKSSNEHPVAPSSSALSSKRNSCTCRKCSIFNLDDCEPKEVSSVIKYLRFRKVNLAAAKVARLGLGPVECMARLLVREETT
jgi:hypothetical protein